MKFKSQQDFFDACRNHNVASADITTEELYHHFKARLYQELGNDVVAAFEYNLALKTTETTETSLS